jgi:hypothetical protein
VRRNGNRVTRVVGALTIVAASLAFAVPVSAQEAPPELTTTTTPPTTVAPTTTTTLAPCDPNGDIAVTFVGSPVIRANDVITFSIDRVLAGQVSGDRIDVVFPRDERFLIDKDVYVVTASFNIETRQLESKVRRLPTQAAHCFVKDPIVTQHADSTPIDTGVFSGMSGNWTRVPLAFAIPLGVSVGILTVLVIVRRSTFWAIRRTIGRRLEARRRRRLQQQVGV